MTMSHARRLIHNFASLLTSEVVNRATTFVLYALVARYRGAFEFGQLSLALSLFFVFEVLAGAGLKTLVTREVARDRAKTGLYLVNGSAIVVACSLLSLAALLFVVRLMDYSRGTASVILLVSLGVLPYSLSTVNKAIFQAWERMHYIAWANVPVHVVKVALAFVLLWRGHGLLALVVLLLACHGTILVLEWWLMLRHITRPCVRFDGRFCMAMIRSTTTFLGITGIVAINLSLPLLLLSGLTNETEVGLYNAAAQLVTPLIVVYETIMLSVFPEMCRRFAIGLEGLERLSGYMLELLLAIAVPIVIGLLFLAEPVLLLLYGDADFALASETLWILAWMLISMAYTQVIGRALVAGLREKVTLRILVATTLLKLLLGLLLISQFGLMGAAAATLVTALLEALLHYAAVSRWLFPMPLGKLAWKPAVAGTTMGITLALVQGQELLLSGVSAGAIYIVVLLALVIWSNGGVRQFTAKYQHLWSS